MSREDVGGILREAFRGRGSSFVSPPSLHTPRFVFAFTYITMSSSPPYDILAGRSTQYPAHPATRCNEKEDVPVPLIAPVVLRLSPATYPAFHCPRMIPDVSAVAVIFP
ncbi:hypothetical protein PTI98_011678 [Pleurotus ostreatus]|nr:hypothetical protein PTI98_011678 [Pleurotus ostreatus]